MLAIPLLSSGIAVRPGIHLVERSLWRFTAKLLWAFDISEPVDPETGKVQHLDPNAYPLGVLSPPLPFKVAIKHRSEQHRQSIENEHLEVLQHLRSFE